MNPVAAEALLQVGGVLLFMTGVIALLNKLGGNRHLLFNDLRKDLATLRFRKK